MHDPSHLAVRQAGVELGEDLPQVGSAVTAPGCAAFLGCPPVLW